MSSSDSWTLIGLTILVVLLLFYLSKKMICGSGGNGQPGESIGSSDLSGTSPTEETPPAYAYRYEYESQDPNYHYQRYQDYNHHHQYQETLYGNGGSNSADHHLGYGNSSSIGSSTTTSAADATTTSLENPHQSHDDTSALMVPIQVSVVSDAANDNAPDINPTTAASPTTMISNRNMTMDRKNIIESQLRAQIIKMVQAEREVRRLAHLLSIEQGLNGEDYIGAFRNNLLYPQHHHYQQHYHHQQLQLQQQLRGLTSGELILSAQSLPFDHNHHHHQQQPPRAGPGDQNNSLDSDQPPPYDQCVP